METAFQAVCDGGGLCLLACNLPQGEVIALNTFDLIKGKRIVGTWGEESQPDRGIPLYANLYLSGRLKIQPLITQSNRQEEINRALDDLEAGKMWRALIAMTEGLA
jgi:Zn-dependent alcohol dehydrogenase